MKQLKEKLTLILVSLSLTGPSLTSLGAQEFCPSPCEAICYDYCDHSLSFGVDFIYWQPCFDNLEFATKSKTSLPSGSVAEHSYRYETVKPDWFPGFRLRAEKNRLFCNWNLFGSYTWITASNDQSHWAPNDGSITNLLLHPNISADPIYAYNTINSKWRATYQHWDLLLACPLNICENQFRKPYFGAAGVVLHQRLRTHNLVTVPDSKGDRGVVQGTSDTKTFWSAAFWGVGLKAGTAYEYRIGEDCYLTADGSAVIVAGDASNKNKQRGKTPSSSDDFQIQFNDRKGCHILPGYRVAAGIHYDTCVCGWNLALRAGYEFVQWHNVSNPRIFFTSQQTNPTLGDYARSTSNSTATMAFQGFYAGAEVKF